MKFTKLTVIFSLIILLTSMSANAQLGGLRNLLKKDEPTTERPVGDEPSGDKAKAGSGIGGLVGGFAGRKLLGDGNEELGIIAGALIGSMIGEWIGGQLDAEDQKKHEEMMAQALSLNVGESLSWSSPDKSTSGDVVLIMNDEDAECDLTYKQSIVLASGETITKDVPGCTDADGNRTYGA